MKGTLRQGIRHGIPIGLGYLSVSFAFGMKAVGDGLTVLQAVLISMTNLTSAGQIAALPLMAGGASLAEMALTQLTINLRYALMSLSLSRKLDGSMGTLQRLVFSFANTDEIFAVASSQPGKVGKYYLYGLMIAPWIGWSLGTFLGAAAGTLLPAFVRSALGIAIYGMFLAIILPPAREGPGCFRRRRMPHEVECFSALPGGDGRRDLPDPDAAADRFPPGDQKPVYPLLPRLYSLCGAGCDDVPGRVLFHRGPAHGNLRRRGGGAAGLAGTKPADRRGRRVLRRGPGAGIYAADSVGLE